MNLVQTRQKIIGKSVFPVLALWMLLLLWSGIVHASAADYVTGAYGIETEGDAAE